MNRNIAIASAVLAFLTAAGATEQHGVALAKNGMHSVNNSPPPAIGIGIGVQAGAASTAQAASKSTAKATNKQSQGQHQQQSLRNAGNSNVSVGGNSYEESRRPVNTPGAIGLVASPGTCLGSASGGVQGSSIGIAFGTTVRDDGCHLVRRMVVLDQLGLSDAALALACLEDDNIRESMTRVGRSCTTGRVSATWNVRSPAPVVAVAVAKPDRN